MFAAATSVSTIAAVTTATSELSLQPGIVVDAKVVQLLKNDLVRIALQGVLIDALSEVPLQVGQTLKLAVSQTLQGVRLAIVPQEAEAQPASSRALPSISQAKSSDTTRAPLAPAEIEAQAVAVATQSAAARQSGLSQLFSNLSAATQNNALPKTVQQAVAQVVALQPSLDEAFDGAQLKQAFRSSGLFREAALVIATQAGIAPDLKSALIVLRQTLSVALADEQPAALPQPAATALPATAKQASPTMITASLPVLDDAPVVRNAAEILIAKQTPSPAAITTVIDTRSMTPGADLLLDLLAQIMQTGDGRKAMAPRMSEAQAGTVRGSAPPPPFRGAAPSAQAVMPSTLAPDMASAVKQLLDDTEGAIARQTLLQIASLPDRAELPGLKTDPASPRWAFEIPFATPRGTAVAQFEISGDGGGNAEAAAVKRVWCARFSLDIEPAGPVHAIVSLAGEATSVRLWAERPLTAARLRAGSAELAQALQQAALQPGDIVIGEGSPPQAAAPAGHFIDRAS